MFSDVATLMSKQGVDKVLEAAAEFQEHYANRRIVSEFLKDTDLGSKRLISMPDRVTSMVSCADGSVTHRSQQQSIESNRVNPVLVLRLSVDRL